MIGLPLMQNLRRAAECAAGDVRIGAVIGDFGQDIVRFRGAVRVKSEAVGLNRQGAVQCVGGEGKGVYASCFFELAGTKWSWMKILVRSNKWKN